MGRGSRVRRPGPDQRRHARCSPGRLAIPSPVVAVPRASISGTKSTRWRPKLLAKCRCPVPAEHPTSRPGHELRHHCGRHDRRAAGHWVCRGISGRLHAGAPGRLRCRQRLAWRIVGKGWGTASVGTAPVGRQVGLTSGVGGRGISLPRPGTAGTARFMLGLSRVCRRGQRSDAFRGYDGAVPLPTPGWGDRKVLRRHYLVLWRCRAHDRPRRGACRRGRRYRGRGGERRGRRGRIGASDAGGVAESAMPGASAASAGTPIPETRKVADWVASGSTLNGLGGG